MEVMEVSTIDAYPSFLVTGAETPYEALKAPKVPTINSRQWYGDGEYVLTSLSATSYDRTTFLVQCGYQRSDVVAAWALNEIIQGGCD
jgi:hypothetical protein